MGANLIRPVRPPSADNYPSLLTAAVQSDVLRDWLDRPDRGAGVEARNLGCLHAQPWAIGCEGPVDCAPDGYEVGPVSIGDPMWDPDGDPAEDPTSASRSPVTEPTLPGLGRFFPWTFHVHVGGGNVGLGEDWATLADEAIERDTARELSRELWTGRYTRGHSLMRDAIDITPSGGAVNLAYALGVLADAVDTYGTFHVPLLAASEMAERGLVRWSGSLPVTAEGWPISFGPGYSRGPLVPSPWRPDTTPGDPAATLSAEASWSTGEPVAEQSVDNVLAASASLATGAPLLEAGAVIPTVAGEAFIVAHPGLVEYAIRDVDSPALTGRPVDDMITRANLREVLRRREAIVRYTSCAVYAVRVKLAVR